MEKMHQEAYQNIHFFDQGPQKKAKLLKFDHFSHSMWSSNSGHEQEKGGHMNPMVLYCTIDLCHIETYIFGQDAQKRQYF